LMQHETYRTRFENSSLSFIEINYVLLQAYDFLHLYREHGCLLQVGGNDQWFNILAGTELIRRAAGGSAFALTSPLIEGSGGRKMSKSEGTAIWLDPEQTSPYDYYQYWRNASDHQVGQFLRIFTFLPLEHIAELERLQGADINRAKEVLAFEATKLLHGEDEARRAQETARARFQGEGEDQGPSVTLSEPTALTDLIVEARLAPSKGEAKRLLKQGGVRVGDVKQDQDRQVDPSEVPALLSVGKRKVRLVRPALSS
jgi:tyrosyl-tRNA synthetase